VFVGVVPHAVTMKTVPDTCRDPDSLACLLLDLSHRHAKPMVVPINAGRSSTDFVAVLEEGGLPLYEMIMLRRFIAPSHRDSRGFVP
jgi:3-hydroxypropionyl-CoA synthetase (ADP-forming)